MTLFFFVVASGLKRELVRGEFRSPRMAAFSIAAALGGMLVPAALYLTLQLGRESVHGWGTVMATDTAFVIGCRALLGRRIPQSLRILVEIGYSRQVAWGALALGALGITSVRGMALLGSAAYRPTSWWGRRSGWPWMPPASTPPAPAGVLGLLTPTGRWVSDDRLLPYGRLRQRRPAIWEALLGYPVVT